MTRVYRILRRPYSKIPLDGEGAYRFGGRWSSPGNRIAYTAEHLSLAMLEYFVHIDPDDPPKELANTGSGFVRHGQATILIVPSALAPTESNWLINPLHPGFSKLRIHPAEPFEYDCRFFA